MTFQNLLSRIPKWNLIIVEEERKRIIERSGCNYLEDLITCVHIIQLKVLTCIRVGNKQKQIDISIPKLDNFIHKVYIHVARKLYLNIYLFENNITPLQAQKNNRELEIIVQECILTTIRESIPTEDIIRAYMDESIEHEEEVTIEQSDTPILANLPTKHEEVEPVIGVKNVDDKEVVTRLSFNDYDTVLDGLDHVENISAPKTLERLEEISSSNALQRKLKDQEDDDDDEEKGEKIKIHEDNETFDLNVIDVDKPNPKAPDELGTSFLDIEEIH
jgi:hypothetical protein